MFEFKAVCISISHMEEGDIRVLQVLSSTTNYLTCDSYLEWIHDTPYGCVIRMYDFKRHLLALKRGGVSKFLRKNLILMHREGGYLLFHFDSDADYYPYRCRRFLRNSSLLISEGFLVHGDFLIFRRSSFACFDSRVVVMDLLRILVTSCCLARGLF